MLLEEKLNFPNFYLRSHQHFILSGSFHLLIIFMLFHDTSSYYRTVKIFLNHGQPHGSLEHPGPDYIPPIRDTIGT